MDSRRGFTLVEILVATALTLLLMGMVVTIFGEVGSSVSGSRSLVTTIDQLRAAQRRLQIDLNGATARTLPPLRPEDNRGYLEIVEGPIGPIVVPSSIAFDDRGGVGLRDTTFGDADDILMFTVRSRPNEPFVGRFSYMDDPSGDPPEDVYEDSLGEEYVWRAESITSEVAEVCWFVRGRTLHRRVLLVLSDRQLPDSDRRDADVDSAGDPIHTPLPVEPGFYRNYDISAHQVGGTLDRSPLTAPIRVVPNTLGDLTRREWRYGHQPYVYPHEVRFWGGLGLPTLRECSFVRKADPLAPGFPVDYWPFPLLDPGFLPSGTDLVQSSVYGDAGSQVIWPSHENAADASDFPLLASTVNVDWAQPTQITGQLFDPWTNPYPTEQLDPETGTLVETRVAPVSPAVDDRRYLGSRIAEDVILNNVLSFDIKVYDSGAPIIQEDATLAVIMPGDPGYATAAAGVGSTHTIISFGAYVDLGYMATFPASATYPSLPDYTPPAGAPPAEFHHSGNPFSGLGGSPQESGILAAATWCSWNEHYEHDGLNQDGDGYTDEHADGFDNPSIAGSPANNDPSGTVPLGGIDDPTEREAPPPYDAPLRGLQIRIRVFEPNSRQIREVTVVQDFLPG